MPEEPSNLIPAATTPESLRPFAYHPENSAWRPCYGGQSDVLLTGEQTGGWLSAWFMIIPPDNGPPPHIHWREDEVLMVMEGTFQFYADGRWFEGGPGTTVFLPRGQAHCFRNAGQTPGRLCVLATPAGMETFFRLSEEPFHRPEGPDLEAITAIATDHGLEFVEIPPPPRA